MEKGAMTCPPQPIVAHSIFGDVADKPRAAGALRGFSRNPDPPLRILNGKCGNHVEMSESTYRNLLAAWGFEVVQTQSGVLFIGPNHFFSLPHEPRNKAERKIAIAHIRSLSKH